MVTRVSFTYGVIYPMIRHFPRENLDCWPTACISLSIWMNCKLTVSSGTLETCDTNQCDETLGHSDTSMFHISFNCRIPKRHPKRITLPGFELHIPNDLLCQDLNCRTPESANHWSVQLSYLTWVQYKCHRLVTLVIRTLWKVESSILMVRKKQGKL